MMPHDKRALFAGLLSNWLTHVTLRGRRCFWLLTLTLSSALSGCLPDLGTSASPASPAAPTLPQVQSTVPAAAETGVPIDRDVTVTFSTQMNASTLTTSSITVSAGGVVIPGIVTYAGITATLSFTGNLEYNKTYTLTVTTAAQDTNRNALRANYTSTFTTAVPPAGAINVTSAPYNATGDGITDDTAAFVSALTALDAAAGNRSLIIPPGTYSVRPDQLNMRNTDATRTLNIIGTQATLATRQIGWAGMYITGPNLSVSGITMDGKNLATTGIEVITGTTDLTVRKTVVQNITHPSDPASPRYNDTPKGIRIEGNGTRMTFDHVQIRNVLATHANPTSMVARGLIIDNGGGAGLNPSTNITIQNSTFDEVGPKDDGDCIVIQNPPSLSYIANLSILNNSFDRCHKRAIKIQVSGATISGNQINNPFLGDNPYLVPSGPNVFDMFSGIAAYANNVTISGNTINGKGSYYNAIEVGAGAAINNISITSNTMSNGQTSDVSTPSSLIRTFSNVDFLTITGNTLDFAMMGLHLNTTLTNTNISNNTITRTTYPIYP